VATVAIERFPTAFAVARFIAQRDHAVSDRG
jgi:hypothetical protein